MQDPSGMRVRRRMDKSRTVPTDQQPFNELQELKEDPLFGWAQEDFKVTCPSFSSVGPTFFLCRLRCINVGLTGARVSDVKKKHPPHARMNSRTASTNLVQRFLTPHVTAVFGGKPQRFHQGFPSTLNTFATSRPSLFDGLVSIGFVCACGGNNQRAPPRYAACLLPFVWPPGGLFIVLLCCSLLSAFEKRALGLV